MGIAVALVSGFYAGAYVQNVSDTFQVLMAQCVGAAPHSNKL